MVVGKRRIRRVYSVSMELLTKSREAALAAVQIFNNPMVSFKSEIFIVLMNIAWTYLLHAYYRKNRIEYRYFTKHGKRRIYDKTKSGARKCWELERCLDCRDSPVDRDTVNNLKFLIGIRHEIEHQMTTRIDPAVSPKFQACCLNFNEYIKRLFGEKHGIDRHLAFSLQFSSMSREQVGDLPLPSEMPPHIRTFIDGFERQLSDEEFGSRRFAYRVHFEAVEAKRKGQADEVIEFVRPDSPMADGVEVKYAFIKETERPKHLPKGIVQVMKNEGYVHFTVNAHTNLWKQMDGKNPAKGYGVVVQKAWYWYDKWVELVRKHCQDNAARYGA